MATDQLILGSSIFDKWFCMATITRFEDLEIWQLARKLSHDIYVKSQQGTFAKDFPLRDQINSSSGSVSDNIAEGFERGENKEFVQFLSFAKGSSGECRSQVYRALDRGHITTEAFDDLNERLLLVARKIGSFMKYLQGSEVRGIKFRRGKIGSAQPETSNPKPEIGT